MYQLAISKKEVGGKLAVRVLLVTGTLLVSASPLVSGYAVAQSTPGLCQTATSDPDGDGWGWEGGATCVVATETSATESNICTSTNADPDGDGWGWENNASCIIQTTTGGTDTSIPTCESTTADTDGDGWGWENGQSCEVSSEATNDTDTTSDTDTADTTPSYVVCTSATADSDGDGWGWENGQSCTVTLTNTGSDPEPEADPDTDTDTAGTSTAALSCQDIAASFKTKGSANANLPDPEVAATCVDDTVVITSNQIPDFPYIPTSPGNPVEYDLEYTIPATPTVGATVTDIPALGAIGMAINGIPIYGATEGTGGDVLSLAGGFTECGAHNGPTGYHYHTFSVIGSDVCLFSEAEASAAPQLFGFAFDGYPIYSGNFQYTSSWYLSDASLFATDTFSAHTYVEGSGDLDQCNGRTDADGNYAYYTTEAFPYTLGCYRGEAASTDTGTGPGQGPGQGPGPGQ